MSQIWTDEQINELVDECLNDLAKKVQDRINQPYGDWAGLYFSDGIMRGNIDDYVRYEMDHAKTPTEWGFKAFQATRKFVPNASKVEILQEESTDPALIYDDSYYILMWGKEYLLILENCQYSSTNLEELERRLYEWQINA
jgi:hypothetical protein